MPRESTIKIQRSVTAAATPSGLTAGELAVNLADRKLFVGGTAGSNITFLDSSAVVTSFNGLTGAVTGVASVNGSTGAVVTYVGPTGNIPYRYGAGVGITANSYFTLSTGGALSDQTDILTISGVTSDGVNGSLYGNTEARGLRFNKAVSDGLGLDEGSGASIEALGKFDDGGGVWGSNLSLVTPLADAGGSAIKLSPQGTTVVTVSSTSISTNVPFDSLIVGTEGLGLISSASVSFEFLVTNQTIASVLYDEYRSAEFFVQASTDGGAYEALRITAIHDGSSTWNTQYGVIRSGASLGTYTTILHAPSGRLRLRVTSTTANTTYKTMITALPV